MTNAERNAWARQTIAAAAAMHGVILDDHQIDARLPEVGADADEPKFILAVLLRAAAIAGISTARKIPIAGYVR